VAMLVNLEIVTVTITNDKAASQHQHKIVIVIIVTISISENPLVLRCTDNHFLFKKKSVKKLIAHVV
jgi:hypothetical protein